MRDILLLLVYNVMLFFSVLDTRSLLKLDVFPSSLKKAFGAMIIM
jgi:hypothetical protein